MLVAAALAAALGWQLPCAPLRAASECRARSIGLQLPTERTGDTFLAVIDLGEGDGTVTHEFRPYFSSSALITMRYPVPHVLEAEPIQGVIKVTKSGDGLFEGDVRRLPGSLRTAPHRTAPLALTPPPSHRRPHAAALARCDSPSAGAARLLDARDALRLGQKGGALPRRQPLPEPRPQPRPRPQPQPRPNPQAQP